MELVNTTPFVVGCTLGTDKNGLDYLLTIAKATFNFPRAGISELATEQRPLVAADEFSGEPGYSATLTESDYALYKPRCDVLLNGCAYSPGKKSVSDVVVSLRVGEMNKSFRVTGYRQWVIGLLTDLVGGNSRLFSKIPFSYDTAFGGIDNFHADARKHSSYFKNPVGVGYHKQLDKELVQETPMPNTEGLGEKIRFPVGEYMPMAFGPVGRGWPQRLKYAGTYDADWQQNQFPFLPKDFNVRYFQAAPPDQQVEYLRGGERVELQNLTEEGICAFRLPRMEIDTVVFYLRNGEFKTAKFQVDTLHFFPEEGVYTMTARASVPFSEDPQACSKVIFGRGSKAWIKALEHGKIFVSKARKLSNCRPVEEQAELELEE